MLKVGVKYCGGCNPRYDRGEFVAKIIEELIDKAIVENADKFKEYDVLLVVCGCTSCCAEHSEIKANRKILITDDTIYDDVIRQIKNI